MSARPRHESLPLLILGALYLLTRVPFAYLQGFPDGDQQHIALGVWEAMRSGTGFHGARLYAVAVSPLYHALLFALAPLYRSSPEALHALMSGLGAGAGLVAHVFLFLLLRRLWGSSAAWLGTLVWMFAPGWWEVTTFGHPSVLALAFLLGAMLALIAGGRAPIAIASILFIASLGMRADMIFAGAIFPALLWLREREGWRSLAKGAVVPVVATLAWMATTRIFEPTPPASAGSGLLERFLSVLQVDRSVYKKELVILVLGVGPVAAIVALAGWLGSAAKRRGDALLVASALGLPALFWWIHVEGPFRHLLVPALALLIPAAALARDRSLRFAVVAGVAIVVANQLVMVGARQTIENRYSWSYQPTPGEPRWSARAPIGDWWSSHRAAQHGVRDQARWARDLASLDSTRLLVPTPLPFRYELAILSRGRPYAYRSYVDPGALWFELTSGGSTYLFLEGGPEATQQAIDRAAGAGELASYEVWIPPDSRPTKPLVLPAGMREVSLDDPRQRPAP